MRDGEESLEGYLLKRFKTEETRASFNDDGKECTYKDTIQSLCKGISLDQGTKTTLLYCNERKWGRQGRGR